MGEVPPPPLGESVARRQDDDAGFLKMIKEVPYLFVKVVSMDDFNLAKKLLTLGANVNDQDELGYTALAYAAKKGNVDMVELLLDHGADPNMGGGNLEDNVRSPNAMCEK